jgi:hypothetical protein
VNCTHPTPSLLTRAAAAFVVLATFSACSSAAQRNASAPLKVLPPNELDGLLLSASDVGTVMGTTGMVAGPTSSQLEETTPPLVSNLNCLGIWQNPEKAIYGDSGLSGVRRQTLRQPDSDQWVNLVVQAAVAYPNPDGAKAFFNASSDRWSQCTNHRLNITINDQPKKTWFFGDLKKSDSELSMTVTRGENEMLCQHALSVVSNVILDVRACNHNATDQAHSIVRKMTDRVPHQS